MGVTVKRWGSVFWEVRGQTFGATVTGDISMDALTPREVELYRWVGKEGHFPHPICTVDDSAFPGTLQRDLESLLNILEEARRIDNENKCV
jgi:hypothetical protein